MLIQLAITGLLVALLAVAVVWVVQMRTVFGAETRAAGLKICPCKLWDHVLPFQQTRNVILPSKALRPPGVTALLGHTTHSPRACAGSKASLNLEVRKLRRHTL